jgi:DNA-binding FadR family transcriptional regulator
MKTSELTAVEIVRDIAERNLRLGDKLPVETEMLAQYKISRSSLREALRLLEVQGLINIRTGPNGGTTVGRPSPINLARTAIPYLHLAGATYGQALEAWAQTQMLLAYAAAANPDRARVRAAMRPFMKDASRTHQWKINEGIGFHDTIAMLSDNPVLDLMLQSIARIVSDHILNMIPMDPPLATRLVRDHEELAAAIHDGKAERAKRLMEIHAAHARKELARFAPQRVGERIRWLV